MTPLQTIVFGVMWLAVLTLAGLVLILYRQVERAYGADAVRGTRVLPRGSPAPPIEVLDRDRSRQLDLSGPSALLVFLETGCPSCEELLPALHRSSRTRVLALVSGQGPSKDFSADCETYWLTNPPDVIREYGIGTFPTAYVVSGSKIAAAASLGSVEDYQLLVAKVEAETDVMDAVSLEGHK